MYCWRMECWVRKAAVVTWRVEVGEAVEVRQMKKKYIGGVGAWSQVDVGILARTQ